MGRHWEAVALWLGFYLILAGLALAYSVGVFKEFP